MKFDKFMRCPECTQDITIEELTQENESLKKRDKDATWLIDFQKDEIASLKKQVAELLADVHQPEICNEIRLGLESELKEMHESLEWLAHEQNHIERYNNGYLIKGVYVGEGSYGEGKTPLEAIQKARAEQKDEV